jgi:hypothetical protein
MARFDDPAFFGDRWADVYDERTTLDPAPAVAFPAGLAGGLCVLAFDSQGLRLYPVALRYCWPSELDLMAEKAGLRLRQRYADWDRRPFASDSASVYRLG